MFYQQIWSKLCCFNLVNEIVLHLGDAADINDLIKILVNSFKPFTTTTFAIRLPFKPFTKYRKWR